MTKSNTRSFCLFLLHGFLAAGQRILFAVLTALFVTSGVHIGELHAALDRTLTGKVIDETGRPVPGATVAAIANSRIRSFDDVLDETKAGTDGEFKLELGFNSEETHKDPWLIWRAPGKGVGYAL